MRFKEAVLGTKGLTNAYRPGLQGLREVDRERIVCQNTRSLRGSIDLDQALKDSHANDPRWDYGIGVSIDNRTDRIIWVEVHPASSRHIDEVLNKHRWLKGWLVSSAPLLDRLDAAFVWIASGKVALPPNSPQRQRIATQGIRFAGGAPPFVITRRYILPILPIVGFVPSAMPPETRTYVQVPAPRRHGPATRRRCGAIRLICSNHFNRRDLWASSLGVRRLTIALRCISIPDLV